MTAAKVIQIFLICWIKLIVLTGCVQTAKFDPDFDEEKMINILCDVHLAEAVIQNEPGGIRDSLTEVYYEHIYRIHQTNEEEFLENRKIWFDNPERVDRLYEKILEELSRRESESEASTSKSKSRPKPEGN